MAGERQNYKSKSSTTATAPTDATRNINGQLRTAATSAATAAAPANAAQTSELWVRVESRSRPGRFYWTTTDGLRSQWTRPAARKILPPTNVAGNLGPGAQIPVQVPLYPVERRSYGHESVKPFQVVVESDYDPDIFNYLDIKAGETIIVIGKMKNDINVTWLYGYKFGSSPEYSGKFPTEYPVSYTHLTLPTKA